jgi:SAM-dependent methyltransferase
MPVPDEKLIERVAGVTDRDSFLWLGRESVRELERTLAIVGRSPRSFESILDFGCGCGRMLLWLESIGRERALHGTDVDAEAVEWCRRHLPYVSLTVNEPDPPLPYPDGAFDLVFNHSVFTHLDERRQDLWLTELRRVVRPGGFVVLSTHGEVALADGAWALRDRVEREGIVYLDKSMPRELGLPDWYQNTWHAPWYIFEHWGWWFEVRGYVPGGALAFQDQVLLERTPDDRPPRVPLAARPRLASEQAPMARVRQALADTRAYRAGSKDATSRVGSLRMLARRAVLRAIRPYTVHQDSFDEAVATSIDELTRAVNECASNLRRLEDGRQDARSDQGIRPGQTDGSG